MQDRPANPQPRTSPRPPGRPRLALVPFLLALAILLAAPQPAHSRQDLLPEIDLELDEDIELDLDRLKQLIPIPLAPTPATNTTPNRATNAARTNSTPATAEAEPDDDDWVIDIEGSLEAARDWAAANLDDRVAEAIDGLAEPSPDKTRRAVAQLQREFLGDSVLDLARIRRVAELVLPLLDQYEETAELAPWLRSRIDYFDVVEELARETPAPPARPTSLPSTNRITGVVTVVPAPPTRRVPERPAPGLATNRPVVAQARTNPPATAQRAAWARVYERRPLSTGGDTFAQQLKPVFTEAGAPAELVWLAEVESSFNPNARSPVGAVGLFQLMPATARSLGLKTFLPDERRQPRKSARAAATYLLRLHRRFGDWRLALAAYNAGEGRIQRLLDRHEATTFDAISPHLPAETQMYVPKFESVLRRREGKSLDDLRLP